MAVAKNLQQYRDIQRRRIKNLKKVKRRTPIISAKHMVAQCRSMAPRKTGRMLGTIRRRKNSVRVGGANPVDGWPYVHWVNDTPGMNLTSWGRKYRSAKVRKTGTADFFWIAKRRTRKFARGKFVKATRKALRAQF